MNNRLVLCDGCRIAGAPLLHELCVVLPDSCCTNTIPPVKLGVAMTLRVIAMLDQLDHSFFPTLSQWVMTNDPNDPTLR